MIIQLLWLVHTIQIVGSKNSCLNLSCIIDSQTLICPVSNNYEFTLLEGNTRFILATQYYIHIIHKKEIKQVYGYIPSHKVYETI